MLKQTLRLWQYKHFDSPRPILRVNPHTKANTSTRSVCLLLVGKNDQRLWLVYVHNEPDVRIVKSFGKGCSGHDVRRIGGLSLAIEYLLLLYWCSTLCSVRATTEQFCQVVRVFACPNI